MRSSTVLTNVAVTFSGCLLAAATPITTDFVVARSQAVTFVSTTHHMYDGNGAKLAMVRDGVATGNVTDLATLESLHNPQIVTKTIDVGVSITQAVCSGSGAITCAQNGAVAVFGAFFARWYSRRDLDGSDSVIDSNTEYPPIPGCGTPCRLKFEAEEGPWRSIGNVTVSGILHELHYQRNGTFSGLRAIQHGTAEEMSRRQTFKNGEDNHDGGMVVDYYWLDENKKAYDSFHSTSSLIHDFAGDAIADMKYANTIIECAEFDDSDGLLNAGLLTVGWHGHAYQFNEPGESEGYLRECYSETS